MIDVIEGNTGSKQDDRFPPKVAQTPEEVMTTEQFLCMVGSRVRKNRMDISMSRKLLAKRSGVSERYLAQLESGQGNISIKLLRKVAQAIDVKLDQLMSEQTHNQIAEKEV